MNYCKESVRMILTVDIGNSNITLGGFADDELLFVSRISTDPLRTVDEYSVRILESLSLHKMNSDDIEGSIIASVVPPLNAVISESIRFITGRSPIVVGPGIKSGIGIRCDIPSSVGADLVAASVAAHFIYGSPSLIIDIASEMLNSAVNTLINLRYLFFIKIYLQTLLRNKELLIQYT